MTRSDSIDNVFPRSFVVKGMRTVRQRKQEEDKERVILNCEKYYHMCTHDNDPVGEGKLMIKP